MRARLLAETAGCLAFLPFLVVCAAIIADFWRYLAVIVLVSVGTGFSSSIRERVLEDLR